MIMEDKLVFYGVIIFLILVIVITDDNYLWR